MTSKSDNTSVSRHQWWYHFVYATLIIRIIRPILRRRFNVNVKHDKRVPKGSHIILANHAAHFDFVILGSINRNYTRWVMTDAVIRKPLPRFILPKLIDFIYRRKGQSADAVVEAVRNSIAKGINVTIQPEGSVTNNGATKLIRKRTGQMIKDSNGGLVTIRLWGNYLKKPDWAENESKGPVFGELVGIYSKDDLSKMTAEEINDLIARDLYVNAYEWNRKERIPYDRKCRAECMERVVYICPSCKHIHTMKSEKDSLFCKECGYKVDVDECGFFVGENVIFDNLYDWDVWQIEELRKHREEWIADPEMKIIELEHQRIDVVGGDGYKTICDDATVSLTSCKLTIRGDGVDMDVDLKDVISFMPIKRDTTGLNIGGTFYQIKSHIPMDNRSLRTAHKILKNENPD